MIDDIVKRSVDCKVVFLDITIQRSTHWRIGFIALYSFGRFRLFTCRFGFLFNSFLLFSAVFGGIRTPLKFWSEVRNERIFERILLGEKPCGS